MAKNLPINPSYIYAYSVQHNTHTTLVNMDDKVKGQTGVLEQEDIHKQTEGDETTRLGYLPGRCIFQKHRQCAARN